MILPRSGIRAKPGSGGFNRSVLFALATLLVVNLSLACDDEQTEVIDAAQEVNSPPFVDLSEALTGTDDSEESRAKGPVPIKPITRPPSLTYDFGLGR